jgi:N-acetylmuramoyl-L-alanine amidase
MTRAVFRLAPPLVVVALFLGCGVAGADRLDDARFQRVVIDAGHGGADYGARGASGALEKDVVLDLSRRIGAELESRGVTVIYTRQEDRFVPLSERTELANRSRADLFLSIHANASPDRAARGAETYFLSLDASDDEARRVAMTENQVFDREEAVADSGDVVGAILGDLIRTEHLRASSEAAGAIQRELGGLSGPSRGVKQAPFVVLMGVNMPAALLELGFLTNPREERALRSAAHQKTVATAIADALEGLSALPAPASPEKVDP